MNILIFDREFPPNIHGGIGTYNYSLAIRLSQIGYKVVVLSLSDGDSIQKEKKDFGLLFRIPYKPIWKPVGAIIRWADELRLGISSMHYVEQLITENDIDIMEIPSAGGYGAFAANRFSTIIPVITRFHGSLGKIPIDPNARIAFEREMNLFGKNVLRMKVAQFVNKPLWSLERSLLTSSTMITFPSVYSKKWLEGETVLAEKKLKTIFNGVDIDHIQSLKKRQRRKRILFVGRCSIPKGVSVFLRALPKVLKVHPDLEIVFIGSHPNQKILKVFHDFSNQYPGNIAFPGFMAHEQVLSLIAESLALIAPSFYEICPMNVIEAMSLGLPVIASNTGPFPEIVADGKTGLLFDVGDADSLSFAICEFLSYSHQRAEDFRQASRKKIIDDYDMRNITQQLINMYQTAEI